MIEKYVTLKNLKITNIVSISILSIAIIISGSILLNERPDFMDGGMGFVMLIGYAIVGILIILLLWLFAYLSQSNSIFKNIVYYLCSLVSLLIAYFLIFFLNGGITHVNFGYAIILFNLWLFTFLSRNNTNPILKKSVFYICSLICFLMAIYLIYCFVTTIITSHRPGGYI